MASLKRNIDNEITQVHYMLSTPFTSYVRPTVSCTCHIVTWSTEWQDTNRNHSLQCPWNMDPSCKIGCFFAV